MHDGGFLSLASACLHGAVKEQSSRDVKLSSSGWFAAGICVPETVKEGRKCFHCMIERLSALECKICNFRTQRELEAGIAHRTHDFTLEMIDHRRHHDIKVQYVHVFFA